MLCVLCAESVCYIFYMYNIIYVVCCRSEALRQAPPPRPTARVPRPPRPRTSLRSGGWAPPSAACPQLARRAQVDTCTYIYLIPFTIDHNYYVLYIIIHVYSHFVIDFSFIVFTVVDITQDVYDSVKAVRLDNNNVNW